VRTLFSQSALCNIERAIRESEALHSGQIRFAVEHSLDAHEVMHGLSARARALEVFGELSVWDTEHNNGVLIYFLLADRDFEIVGDRGIHAHVGPDGWEKISRRMEEMIRGGEFEGAVIWGIRAVGDHLRSYFPAGRGRSSELPDRPVVL
jgi:uncharacterized membrane protein